MVGLAFCLWIGIESWRVIGDLEDLIGVQLMDVYLGQEQRKRRLLLEAFKGEINKDFFK